MQNKAQKEIIKSRTDYFSNKIEEDTDNPKKLWNHIQDIGLKNKQKQDSMICLNIVGEVCHDPNTNHFKTFYQLFHLVNKLPQGLNIFTVNSVNFDIFYQKKGVENCNFVLKSVSKDFILFIKNF